MVGKRAVRGAAVAGEEDSRHEIQTFGTVASRFAHAARRRGNRRQDTVRPEVGKPLQERKAAGIKAQKYKEALVKVHDAEVVANKTPHEAI